MAADMRIARNLVSETPRGELLDEARCAMGVALGSGRGWHVGQFLRFVLWLGFRIEATGGDSVLSFGLEQFSPVIILPDILQGGRR